MTQPIHQQPQQPIGTPPIRQERASHTNMEEHLRALAKNPEYKGLDRSLKETVAITRKKLSSGRGNQPSTQELYTAIVHLQLKKKAPHLANQFMGDLSRSLAQDKFKQPLRVLADALLDRYTLEGGISLEQRSKIATNASKQSGVASVAPGSTLSKDALSDLLSVLGQKLRLQDSPEAAQKIDQLLQQLEQQKSDTTKEVLEQQNHSAPSVPKGTPSKAPASHGPSIPLHAPSGFLWKPTSDSDGNLAILLPPSLAGQVATVQVLSPNGQSVMAKGIYSGNGNGGRDHFRFDRPGNSFPAGSIVHLVMRDGRSKDIVIERPDMRGEGAA